MNWKVFFTSFLVSSRESRWFLTRIGSDGYQCFAFDIIIRHMVASKWLKINSSTMFTATNDLFFIVRWSHSDGKKLGKRRGDICRQSPSRQMSDNTIAWWVWMTGSFVSLLVVYFQSLRFSFLFFARLVRKVTTVSQYSFASMTMWNVWMMWNVPGFEFLLIFYTQNRWMSGWKVEICQAESDDWWKKTIDRKKQSVKSWWVLCSSRMGLEGNL